MSFLGMDWSGANFKNKGKGILADPTQLVSNPLFSAGMGILSENNKPFGGDPFGAAMGGILSAKEQKQSDEDRKRQEQMREMLKKWMAAQAGHLPPGGGMVPNLMGQGMTPAAGSKAAAAQQQVMPNGQQPFDPRQMPGMLTMKYLYGDLGR
jgi:hypothetical protein